MVETNEKENKKWKKNEMERKNAEKDRKSKIKIVTQ